MPIRLVHLADLVQGTLLGDGQVEIVAASALQDAAPGHVTLVDQPERLPLAIARRASAVVVPPGVTPALPAIQVAHVHAAFSAIVTHFRPLRVSRRVGISPASVIHPNARLGPDVDVHPGAVIGDDVVIGRGSTIHSGARIMAGCRLGEDVTLYPNAVLYEDTVLGDRAIIHAGAVLGSFGFGYTFIQGAHHRGPQLGSVVVGNDVEIGANTTIDRGAYGPTRIGDGTKIDNLVQIAHNCQIGRHNLLCAQVGIAGSTSTGDYVVMAGRVGVRDHVHIGDRAILGAMAGVINDVPEGTCMVGIPAEPDREAKLKQAALSKLPDMRRELKELKRAVERLTGESDRHAA